MKSRSRAHFRIAALLLGAAFSVSLWAGQPRPRQMRAGNEPLPPVIQSDALQQVVVTAERVAQNLQQVPASLNVLTAQSLGQLKMDTPQDLMAAIPQLQVNGIAGENTPLFALRGISMMDFSVGQTGPVMIYLDQVPLETLALIGGVNMFDLERIEVLLGPQGTLYGHNATAGAISLITAMPRFSNEGKITLGAGNYRRREASGVLNEALIKDKLAARVAFTYTKRDGFLRNIAPGSPNADALDQYGIRSSLLYEPVDGLRLLLFYARSKQAEYSYDVIDGCVTPPISPQCAPGGVGFTGYYRTTTGTLSGTPLGPYQIDLPKVPKRYQDTQSVMLTADWMLPDDYALTSVGSWQEGSLFYPDNTDGAPIDVFKATCAGSTRQLTQELRITSPRQKRFSYIAGLFWEHQLVYNESVNPLFTDPMFNVYGDYRDCVANSFGPGVGYAVGSLINVGCQYVNHFNQFYDSRAAYIKTTYWLTHRLKLHLGLRYNHDNKSMKSAIAQLQGNDGVPIGNIIPGQVVDGQWMPIEALPGSPNYLALDNETTSQYLHSTEGTGDVGLDFDLRRNGMLYLKYSRGYRPGSFNMQFFFSNSDFSAVPPEKLYSIEGGFKSAWLSHRLEVDGALFHYRYIDQQFIDVRPDGSQPLSHIPLSEIYGGELNVAAHPAPMLTLQADMGFLHTRVDQGTLGGGTIGIVGRRLPYAPNFRGVFSADWVAISESSWALMLHVAETCQTLMYEESLNESRLAQGAFGLLSAQMTLEPYNDRWEVRLWGDNLTDGVYFTSEVDLHSLGYDYRHIGEPRMYGADVTYRFF